MDSSLQTMRVLALCAMIAVANAAFNRLQVEIYCSNAVNGINWENGDEGAADEYQRRSCTQLATNMFYCKTDLFTSSTSTDSSSYLVHGSPGIINPKIEDIDTDTFSVRNVPDSGELGVGGTVSLNGATCTVLTARATIIN